jgi:hypothetical protein
MVIWTKAQNTLLAATKTLTTEATEFAEKGRSVFLSDLCALCGASFHRVDD